MGQLLKAVYSLTMGGYWTRNLRAEHIVKVGKEWKLESLVFREDLFDEGEKSEYYFSKYHQVPEMYEKDTFADEEMDEWIVWDLGCILIHLLLGSHKLKSQNIVDKFKNDAFSFTKLGALAGEKFSPEIKDILGKMCHYSPQRRLSLANLVKSGFFSKEVKVLYEKNEGSQTKKIFLSGSSSASQMMNVRKFQPQS